MRLEKNAKGYNFKYEIDQFDYFAIVDLETLEVYFVPAKTALQNANVFTLRLTRPKNNQVQGINFAENFKINLILNV